MVLIFGGAYQGKTAYALKEFKLKEEDVYFCNKNQPYLDFKKPVIDDFENFVWAGLERDIDVVEYLKKNLPKLKDKIIISQDISQGIVPMDIRERCWREALGRSMIFLSGESDTVVRIFCGLDHKIKGEF